MQSQAPRSRKRKIKRKRNKETKKEDKREERKTRKKKGRKNRTCVGEKTDDLLWGEKGVKTKINKGWAGVEKKTRKKIGKTKKLVACQFQHATNFWGGIFNTPLNYFVTFH